MTGVQTCALPISEYCCAGIDAVKQKIREIENNKDATAVEKNLMVTLEVCYEFYLRGFHFDTISIYDSDATAFKITENGLLPPFISVRGLGESAALDTVEKRKGKRFISVEEFSTCCNKLSKTHIEQLKALGSFAGMADTSQITLFSYGAVYSDYAGAAGADGPVAQLAVPSAAEASREDAG